MGFRDVFRLVPASEVANIADVFSRNEILTANELRQIIGRKPSSAPHADELRNKNMPIPSASSTAKSNTPQSKINLSTVNADEL